jgi:hypothetical protein
MPQEQQDSSKGLSGSVLMHFGYICCIVAAFLWLYYHDTIDADMKTNLGYAGVAFAITAFLVLSMAFYLIAYHSDEYESPSLHMHIAYISVIINVVLYYYYINETNPDIKCNWRTAVAIFSTISVECFIYIGVLYYNSINQ